MRAGKHLRGVSNKEQRQYEHIKESAERPAVTAIAPRKWPLERSCPKGHERTQTEGCQGTLAPLPFNSFKGRRLSTLGSRFLFPLTEPWSFRKPDNNVD